MGKKIINCPDGTGSFDFEHTCSPGNAKFMRVLKDYYGILREFQKHDLPTSGPKPHGGNSISSGMAAGSLDVTGDTDCSDSTGAETTTTASSDDDDGGDADPEPARRRPQEHPSQAIAPIPSGIARNATSHPQTGDKTLPNQNVEIALWRLPTVLAHVPVSRSGWWAGVKSGRYPKPVRLSARCVAWRASDIRALVQSL